MISRLLDAEASPAPAAAGTRPASAGAAANGGPSRRRHYEELFGALQSGHLAAAQKAYAAIAGDLAPAASNAELPRIGAALQRADLTEAQNWAQALLFSQPGLAGARHRPGDSTALAATSLPLAQGAGTRPGAR